MNKLLLYIIICLSSLCAELIHPPDDSKLSYIQVLFRWEAENNAISYEFELSSSEDFTSDFVAGISGGIGFYFTKMTLDIGLMNLGPAGFIVGFSLTKKLF